MFTLKKITNLILNAIISLNIITFSYLNVGNALAADATDYQAIPPFVTAGVPPLVMLVMGRDHKLYYEAYNDASDLNDDGVLDVGYNPEIDYYGYFDSYKYYIYSTTNSRFEPAGVTSDKKAPTGNYWSGDFLNYLTMTRMDCLRKVLYGGFRSTDTATETVLQRVYVPQDAHSWGKEYTSKAYNGFDIRDYTPLELPKGASRHLFASTTLSDNGTPILRVLENSVFRIWEWVAIEQPVAGSQGDDGTGRRSITSNNTSGTAYDMTNAGAAGVADDSYTGGGTPTVIKSDDFASASLGTDWVWKDADGGSSTSGSQTGGELVIKATGADVWTGSDQFASYYLDNISGNFDFKLKITQQSNSDGWAKTGIMVRNDMNSPGSSTGYCIVAATPSNGFTFQSDSNANGYLESYATSGSASLPAWVRLTKQGTTFTAYYSTNGSSWTQIGGSTTLSSANTVQDVGIFVTSHNTSSYSTCKFDEMSLTTLVADPPDPSLAFDDSSSTKWNYPDEPSSGTPIWIEFAFTTPVEAKTYSINAGSTDYPRSWTLQGSNDQTTWDVLDTVSGQTLTAGTATTFTCDSSGVYKYYRLVMTESSLSATAGLSVAEIQLLTDPIPATATLTDYTVRVKVCDETAGLEPNSKLYPSGVYKPIGILQRHGENDRMYFGLITGSYAKNTSGGVLRKNIRSIKDEINENTGEFVYKDATTTEGIIKTIDLFRIKDYSYSSYSYSTNCGWIATRAVNEGECRMWGNPIAEMMYEALRYFSGAGSPTSNFAYSGTTDDSTLGLPAPSWLKPYTNAEDINGNGSLDSGEDLNANGIINGFDYCAKPFMLVLSDINPSYDSNQLPGNAFGGTVSTTLDTMNVEALADIISTEEGANDEHFIGQSGTYDGACSPKNVSGFGDIRGLCPEEPTKQGSYYSAAVSYYGNIKDINPNADEDQKVSTYCVGLASPLPNINIKIGDNTITLVPFAKSVGGYSISATKGSFQPTNTIVDFFVEEITDTYGKFRINYEDVEQGADHDMDAIVTYTYQVEDAAGNAVTDPDDGVQVKVSLSSDYAAGSIIQHMGYIMSGSTKDGTYLEVRDADTGASSDPDYFLDTPPGVDPGTTSSWDDNTALPLTATRTFYPGDSSKVATFLKNPLWYAAKWGGFQDYNANDLPDQENEWDSDGDGIPDTYFYVQNALKLEEQLNQSFADILRRTASGTAASVISQSRSGEGAVYQAVFYPEYKDSLGNTVTWVGSMHALFVDSYGNMREDTNGNHKLDVAPVAGDSGTPDRIIVFNDTIVNKYNISSDGLLDTTTATPEFTGTIEDIKFLWKATDWLNSMTPAEAVAQRVNYEDVTKNRYIFTFADANNNMIPDTGEIVPFEFPTTPLSSFTDTSTIFPYINIFPTFEDEPTIMYGGTAISTNIFRTSASHFNDFLLHQYERVIDYIRGADQDEYKSSTTPQYVIPAFRSRQADYNKDGSVDTWRLGDIVYSTPTVVGRPSENYHLLYNDASYGEFLAQFQDRRQVVYTGSNDGMFHAFNGGFFDSSDNSFNTTKTDGTGTPYPLGEELWAYIPYNLLPHLYWLTEENYPHVYYCDLQPKIFDAKILPDDTHYTDSDSDPNWGTFLVAGMRFGGGAVTADMDKSDGNIERNEDLNGNGVLDTGEDTNGNGILDDRTMKSAYFIFDITDPESPPTLLAELSLDNMGYTTSNPTVVPMMATGSNDWYLVFGSGPADSNGSPATATGTSGALSQAISEQSGKIFVVDLKALRLDPSNRVVKTLGGGGTFNEITPSYTGAHYYKEFENNSFIADPVTVDYNMDFSAEAVYFGTVEGNNTSGWNGRMRRIVFNNKPSPADWIGDSTLIRTTGQPISADPNATIDDRGKLWIYFGTGRYFVKGDEPIADQQSYYGIIEPFNDIDGDKYKDAPEDKNGNGALDSGEDANGNGTLDNEQFTWAEVIKPTSSSDTQLVNVTKAIVKDDKSISGVEHNGNTVDTWDKLMEIIDNYTTDGGGWYMDFKLSPDFTVISEKERNISQAALFGELVTFTTYIPSGSMCGFEGESNLYGLYYKTGTPYYEDVMGSTYSDNNGNLKEDVGEKTMIKMISMGKGLAGTPNIHTGKDDGSKAFIQTSTGDIITIKQINPGVTKSGVVNWREGDTECN